MKPHPPSAYAIERAVSAAQQALAELPDDDDLALRIGTLEGQSDVFEVLDRIVECAVADSLIVERARLRMQRIEARADQARDLAMRILEALEVPSLERPLYTASISRRSKAIVTDPDAVPDDYYRSSIDMKLLAKALRAGERIPGAELSNPSPSLTIRTL